MFTRALPAIALTLLVFNVSEAVAQKAEEYGRLIQAISTAVRNAPFERTRAGAVTILNEKLLESASISSQSLAKASRATTPGDIAVLGLAAELLGKLTTDAASVYSATLTGTAQLSVAEATDIWDDKRIRDGYDRVSSVTNLLAGGLLVAATLFSADNKKSEAGWTAAGGALSLSVVPLIKTLTGSSPAKTALAEAKRSSMTLSQIDLSRRAYDDLKLQAAFYETNRQRAFERLGQLKTLDQRSHDLLIRILGGEDVSSLEIESYADDLLNNVSKYELLSQFFGDFVKQYQARIDYYIDTYPALKEKLTKLKEEVGKVESDFKTNVQEPFLTQVPELEKAISDWRAAPRP